LQKKLEHLAGEQDREQEKKDLLSKVQIHRKELEEYLFTALLSKFCNFSKILFDRLRKERRKANIQCKENLQIQANEDRKILMSGGLEAIKAREK